MILIFSVCDEFSSLLPQSRLEGSLFWLLLMKPISPCRRLVLDR
jgi:hypothetical protein